MPAPHSVLSLTISPSQMQLNSLFMFNLESQFFLPFKNKNRSVDPHINRTSGLTSPHKKPMLLDLISQDMDQNEQDALKNSQQFTQIKIINLLTLLLSFANPTVCQE